MQNSILILIFLTLTIKFINCNYEKKIMEINNVARESRSCATNMFGPYLFQQNSKNYLLRAIFCILIILSILILLGITKAILGWFGFLKIGMFGLDKLIDLPRPLDFYQEPELMYKAVEYDIAGWPIHPDTKDRTVRTITKYYSKTFKYRNSN